jgi:hypothetical protein
LGGRENQTNKYTEMETMNKPLLNEQAIFPSKAFFYFTENHLESFATLSFFAVCEEKHTFATQK